MQLCMLNQNPKIKVEYICQVMLSNAYLNVLAVNCASHCELPTLACIICFFPPSLSLSLSLYFLTLACHKQMTALSLLIQEVRLESGDSRMLN